MDTESALRALSALSQPHRLAIFRWLVQQQPAACPVGEIGAEMELAPATLSFHLERLEQAGLVEIRTEGRRRLCSPRLETMRALVSWLLADCCQGRPEACGEVLAALGETDTDCGISERPS